MVLGRSTSILIVDDYKTMLRIFRGLLKQLDFHDVEEASDGTEALNKLRAGRFGLVISDWHMEPMTGFELLQEIRHDPQLKSLPFIMATAENKSEHVAAAKKAGVSGYIVKPFSAGTLKDSIERAFANE